MPRTRFEISGTHPYHIYGRCINKEWFQIPMPIVWRIMSDYLYFVKRAFELDIIAFVLMSNHFHLLLRCPLLNVSIAMQYFMRETSRCISFEAGRINNIWGSRFGRCEIQSEHHFYTAYKYVYRNPVESGLCKYVEEYPYSTLNGLVGLSGLEIPVKNDTILFSDVEETLKWLNTSPVQGYKEIVAKALRKGRFSIAKVNSRPHPLEVDLL